MNSIANSKQLKFWMVLTVMLLALMGGALACNLPSSGSTGSAQVSFSVQVNPAKVASDQNFRVTILFDNSGTATAKLTEVRLPAKLLQQVDMLQVWPESTAQFEQNGQQVFMYDLLIPAGQTVQVVFDFQAHADGKIQGPVEALVDGIQQTAPLRVIVGNPPENPPAAGQPTKSVASQGKIPFRSVVQITAKYLENGNLYAGWTGSGSIITPTGLILTNAHVALPDKYFPVDALMISLTYQDDQAPVPAYYAEVVQADPALDFAVLQITTDINGNPVDTASLNLPAVPLGDSTALHLGDSLTIIGYPGIGGDTITLTSGDVSGFTAEGGYGDRAFIKTSATIAGGNSGGLASNAQGELIGVPTQLGYGGDNQFVDCRVLADTNRDGVIDDQDNCVPTGGFINALRPINLAIPLIEAAKQGEVWAGVPTPPPAASMPVAGDILYQDDFSDPGSGWDTAQLDNGSTGYVNGAYHISVDTDNYYIWSSAGLTGMYDVSISVDASLVQTTGEGDFGILCRYQDDSHFYGLEVSEDGYLSIWRRDGEDYIMLVDWEYNADIPTGGQSMSLTAVCSGDTLALAVNDVVLAEVQDTAFYGEDIGLIAGTWKQGGLEIAYDNLVVRQTYIP